MLNRLTPIVRHLLIINVVIFIGLQLICRATKVGRSCPIYNEYFSLHKSNALQFRDTRILDGIQEAYVETEGGQIVGWVAANKFQPLQIITYFFSHDLSGIFHIFFNMFVLAMFGTMVERIVGSERFLKFYLFCGLFGGILIAFLDPSIAPVVGASGAVMGTTVAFAYFFPKEKLQLMFIPISFEARQFVMGIGAISLIFVVLQALGISDGGGISHFGHLAGMVSAVLFFYLSKYISFFR